ncbi:MAG: fumarylacetoacetate hydrolase family protein [Candidatus Neomarinimicrobiota bacterium]
MRLLTYSTQGRESPRVGFLQDGWVVDTIRSTRWLKKNRSSSEDFDKISLGMRAILADWNHQFARVQNLAGRILKEDLSTLTVDNTPVAVKEASVHFHPPVPDPPTFRDFYAFERHVKAAREKRGLEMDPTWYKIPVFYYSNPTSLYGHRAEVPKPAGTEALDFELELGIIIAGGGKDISAREAQKLIAGFTIINDWSARDIQREEMALNLGPAKGKDFATSVGPYLVTADELEDSWKDDTLDLEMKAFRNGKEVSNGNANDLYHSWGAIIERASSNTRLLPGDLLGSGTVGTGCILELQPENVGGWLKRGDVMRLEIERLGALENTIV